MGNCSFRRRRAHRARTNNPGAIPYKVSSAAKLDFRGQMRHVEHRGLASTVRLSGNVRADAGLQFGIGGKPFCLRASTEAAPLITRRLGYHGVDWATTGMSRRRRFDTAAERLGSSPAVEAGRRRRLGPGQPKDKQGPSRRQCRDGLSIRAPAGVSSGLRRSGHGCRDSGNSRAYPATCRSDSRQQLR